MPYSIRQSGSKWEVFNPETGRVSGRHSSKKKAKAQLRALFANVPDARKSILITAGQLSSLMQHYMEMCE